MQQEEKLTAHQVIRNFISKYAKPAGFFFIAILIVFVIIQIVGVANDKKNVKATLAIEDIQSRYVQTLQENENATFDTVQPYIEELNGVIVKYPKLYAGRRALFLKGDIYYRFDKFQEAAGVFSDFAGKFQDSYLAPICIANTGACYEKMGKPAEAEAEYLKIYNSYRGEYALMPKVIFALGRLNETNGKYADAEKYYQMITDDYSDSNFSLYAQDRIILMKTKGLLN